MNKVFICGFVGNLGTKVLLEHKFDELASHFNKQYLQALSEELDKTVKDGFIPSLSILDNKVVDIEEISKGGALTSLWKLCDRNHWGLTYNLRKIPILQGTIEIANFYDLNPYRLLSQNVKLLVLDVEEDDIIEDCIENGFSYIGDIINSKKRVRIDGESEAFLTKDYKDEIDKILPRYTNKTFAKNKLM